MRGARLLLLLPVEGRPQRPEQVRHQVQGADGRDLRQQPALPGHVQDLLPGRQIGRLVSIRADPGGGREGASDLHYTQTSL